MTIDDPRYGAQWHLALLDGIETVWSDYSGAGVQVGVYDDGMDQTHEDLAANYNASLQFSGTSFTDDGRHDSTWDGHGTAVGGLIAAALNGVGGVGVAWGARLTSVDYLGSLQGQSFATQLEALRHAASFDVVNQSYGVQASYDLGGDIGDVNSWAWQEAQALAIAVTQGRGGLGTVLVKAAGNEAHDATLTAQGLLGNAAGEGHNSLHTVMTVGAFDAQGRVADYSSWGANLWISAPAASHTTDVTGVGGYASGRYTNSFGGTSAATPVVAGVVALMLEAAPGLGYRDVQQILALSAAQTGSAYGGAGTGFERGDWRAFGGETWNGGALTWHASYGYGAVDTLAAVRMAEAWGLWQGAAQVEQSLIRQGYAAAPFATIRNDRALAEVVITVDEGVVIEHLYVTVDMDHARVGDLLVELVTPGGQALVLSDHEQGSTAISDDWTFGVAALAGMAAGGQWRVRVTDTVSGNAGTLNRATLDVLGHAASVNDVWTVTQDFRTLAAVDPGRAVFDDMNGGTDWLNAVALGANVTLTLGKTGLDGALSVGGTRWSSLTDGMIENAATGDGNDVLTGNAMANMLQAGRGHNVLRGGGGADDLSGSGATNVLVGEVRGLYGAAESDRVFRLFDAVFDRAPGLDGHQGFTAQLAAGMLSLGQLAGNLTASAEFGLRYGATSNTEFITRLFQNVFARAPAPEGLANWVAQLDGGRTRGEVVALFSESVEHVTLTATALARFDLHDPTEWTGVVYRLFGTVLGREPAPQGMLDWITTLSDGAALRDVVTGFVAGAEFQARYGATDDEGLITLLFRNVLERDPAPEGLDNWTTALANGMTRAEVVESFMNSLEYTAKAALGLEAFMRGYGTDDLLQAGSARAVLSGGLFADSFVFERQAGAVQQVTDLEPWDAIVLRGFGYADEDAALGHFTQAGADVVFFDQGMELRFLDTPLAMIDAGMIALA
ncbi:DUF4214 domain-containing protein [Sagittula sp. S175]|uniref:DUF4214 domain-containing protein n=1 Tax=Sagittula sp. S175 TaxID=3415129 RepID=UPI003C7D53E0